jgi:ferritin
MNSGPWGLNWGEARNDWFRSRTRERQVRPTCAIGHRRASPNAPQAPGEARTRASRLGFETLQKRITVNTDYAAGLAATPVPTGPSGRAMAQPMDAALLEGLQQHLTMERRASAAYWAMAIWFAERELRGFARYLKAESSNEQSHAGLFADYLLARGQSVQLGDVPRPRQTWSSAEEIFSAVFQMEADVTASLQQLYGMAERAGDVRSTVFLDPIVQSQIEAENEAAHLLGRVRFSRNEPAAMLVIDGELSDERHQPASMA